MLQLFSNQKSNRARLLGNEGKIEGVGREGKGNLVILMEALENVCCASGLDAVLLKQA